MIKWRKFLQVLSFINFIGFINKNKVIINGHCLNTPNMSNNLLILL